MNNVISVPIRFVNNYNSIDVPIKFEEWKLIDEPGVIKNYYFISNFGRLKNINGFILKPYTINSGYLTYRLYTGQKYGQRYKTYLVHRLVMMYFHPIPNMDSLTVNHDNYDKFDNDDDNLSWMTQEENNLDKFVNRNYDFLYRTILPKRIFNSDQLEIIFRELDNGTPYGKILEMINIENTRNNQDYIGNIKRGKTYKKERAEYQINRFND